MKSAFDGILEGAILELHQNVEDARDSGFLVSYGEPESLLSLLSMFPRLVTPVRLDHGLQAPKYVPLALP